MQFGGDYGMMHDGARSASVSRWPPWRAVAVSVEPLTGESRQYQCGELVRDQSGPLVCSGLLG